MISWLQIRLFNTRLASLVFFVISACCACQASPSPLPSASVVPATATLSQTPLPNTATSAPPRLTSAKTEVLPSPTPEPYATMEGDGLSPEGPWLAWSKITNFAEGGRLVEIMLVNQDGSGSTKIRVQECGGSAQNPIIEHPANIVAKISWETYLVNPQLDKAWSLDQQFYPCTTYTGMEQNLLVDKYWEGDNSIPELRIYQLPEGKLLDIFPLMDCPPMSENCIQPNISWDPHAWDPAGENLAFAVLIDSGTALYVYHVKRGKAQEIARFEGGLNNIFSSPNGKNLILGVGQPETQPFVESVQTIPLAGGNPRTLYSLDYPMLQEIVAWLDNDRFLVVDGSLRLVATEGASNLRLVNIRTGQVIPLFEDGFIDVAIDHKTETVVVVNMVYTSSENQGYYLIPIADPKPIYVGELMGYQLDWDEDLGLFITDALCPDDPAQIQAFDPQGKLTCLPPKPESTPPPPPTQSPDGKWSVTLEDGLWIEGPGQPKVMVLKETPGTVIWRPDSGGLFVFTRTGLVHIALPDLTLTEHPLWEDPLPVPPREIDYQWIGN